MTFSTAQQPSCLNSIATTDGHQQRLKRLMVPPKAWHEEHQDGKDLDPPQHH